MKNWIYIIYIGLMGCLVSSCRQSLDEEVQIPVTTGKAQIRFTIALDDINSRSRATWEDNESADNAVVGSVYENQIDLNSDEGLKVFAYDLSGNLLGEVTDKEARKISDNEYSFEGELTVSNLTSETLECLLMVYANSHGGNDTFSYNVQYIPMWGVKKTTLRLAKGELTVLTDPIYLLRSMAKVEVKLNDAIADKFELTSVTVDKYNATGYVVPSYQTLANTENMDQETVFNPYSSLADGSLAFTKVEGENAFYVYLPEYNNSVPAAISVVLNGNTYIIEFKNYVNGEATDEAYNIVRNHYYQYIINSVSETEMEVLIEINSWNLKEHTYEEVDIKS